MAHYWYYITGFFIKYIDDLLVKKDQYVEQETMYIRNQTNDIMIEPRTFNTEDK